MQSLGALTAADFSTKAEACRAKIEVYDGANWIDLFALGSPAENYVKSWSLTPGGAGPRAGAYSGSWSATLFNKNGIFDPFHPTSAYATLLRVGRPVRISLGIKRGATITFYQRLIGYMNDPAIGRDEVSISGDDYSKPLEDFALTFPDNHWGTRATFDAISSSGVTGSELYGEADALRIASEVNDVGGWDGGVGGLDVASVADVGGGSAYVLQFLRPFATGTYYAHEANVASVVVGQQYFISFKSKPVSGTSWMLKFYQTVGGTLTLIDTVYLDSAAVYGTHSIRITALKTGALEMRVTTTTGAANSELRMDVMSVKLYEAAWNVYQLPDECNGPYYVTLGQFAQVENTDIFNPEIGKTYIIGVRYKRVSGTGVTWIGVYQTIGGVFTLVEKIPLTSTSWTTAWGSIDPTSAADVQLRLVSEDGEEDDEIRLARISIQEYGAGATELYLEADALDIPGEANNVSNWTVLSGCTFESEIDSSGGDAYVAVFKRTGSYAEQVLQGARDNNGDWDGYLYDADLHQFRFDKDKYIEAGTGNLNIWYYVSASPEEMVADILAAAGFYVDRAAALAALDYIPTYVTIDRPRFDTGTKAFEVIKKICERVNYCFWRAYDGTPCFKPVPVVKATADFIIPLRGDIGPGDRKQELDQIRNSVSIEGDEERPYSQTDSQRGSRLMGAAADPDSIDAYGLHADTVTNDLFQDQAAIETICAARLAAGKTPAWYSTVPIPFGPVPLETGDTIQWPELLGGSVFDFTGIIQSIMIDGFNFTYNVEIISYVENVTILDGGSGNEVIGDILNAGQGAEVITEIIDGGIE